MVAPDCAFLRATLRGLLDAMSATSPRIASKTSSRLAARTRAWAAGSVGVLLLVASVATAPPASAGLLGNLLCPITNTLGVTSAGWDDGATTPPSTLAPVEQSIGATQLYSKGITGSGIGVALVDSGVGPVPGLTAPRKVTNSPALSFDYQPG